MGLRIQPATEADAPNVAAFNERLKAGGSTWSFYETSAPDWLAADGEALPRRTHFLAVDDRDGTVRGGYVLKQESFLLDGQETVVGNVQGPVSEGIVAKRFGMIGGLLLKDALERAPLQIGWGTSKQKAAVLEGSGWISHRFPLLLRVERQNVFLSENRIFDGKPVIAKAMRLAAKMKMAALPLNAAWALLAARRPSLKRVTVAEEATIGPWADEIWRHAAPHYQFIANRGTASLSRIFPMDAWPNARVLHIARDGATLGWAAFRDRQLSNDANLGSLRAGSIVDALAIPGAEATVIAAAVRHVQSRGVDVIGAIFTHPRWIEAFRRAGFLAVPGRRYFAISPTLASQVPLQSLIASSHLTLVDGDGPRLF